ncbi:hypothetical protein D3C80_1339960 [compost metagenome]
MAVCDLAERGNLLTAKIIVWNGNFTIKETNAVFYRDPAFLRKFTIKLKLCCIALSLVSFEVAVYRIALPFNILHIPTKAVFYHCIQSEIEGRFIIDIDKQARIERITFKLWNC